MRREIAIWKVLAAVVAVLAMSTGGAMALAEVRGEPSAQAPPDDRSTLQPTRSTTFVPITPCRIASTTGGSIPAFGVGETRTFAVTGNLAGQGGQAAGCGIPEAATGIEASISATFNEGPGYLRAWPAGQPEPQATFLNYTAAGAATNTGAVTILAGGGTAFSVKNHRSVTDVVIDVQGYYVRPMYALVNANGSVEWSSRLLEATKTGTGLYDLDFDVDTDSCARAVTVGRSRSEHPASGGFATAHTSNSQQGAVAIQTFGQDGALADRPFLIEITC